MACWHAADGRGHESGPTLSRRGVGVLTIAAIVGPTASGKSEIAEAVARRFHATIISVDSMQVYRRMDIGTAKPDRRTRMRIDYRMVDVCDPSDNFSVHEFQRMARREIEQLTIQYRRIVIAGGSGMHFRAVVDPMTFAPTDAVMRAELDAAPLESLVLELIAGDPGAADHVDLANPRRVIRAVEVMRLTGETPTHRASSSEAQRLRSYEPEIPFVGFGIDPHEESSVRVENRLEEMIEAGFIDEVAELAPSLGTTASHAVGYREFVRHLQADITRDEAIADTLRATNGLVKRQRTFFRRDPRIEWMAWDNDADARIERAVDYVGEKMQWTS